MLSFVQNARRRVQQRRQRACQSARLRCRRAIIYVTNHVIELSACQAARLHRRGTVSVTDHIIQLEDELGDLCPGICRRWLGVDLVGSEGILQKKARVLDQSELGVLIVWNETLQGQYPADLRQLAQLLGSG